MSAWGDMNWATVWKAGDALRLIAARERVRFVRESDDVIRQGTVRGLCGDLDGTPLGALEDVRSGSVRITLDTGFDYYVPMPELMEMTAEGRIAPIE